MFVFDHKLGRRSTKPAKRDKYSHASYDILTLFNTLVNDGVPFTST